MMLTVITDNMGHYEDRTLFGEATWNETDEEAMTVKRQLKAGLLKTGQSKHRWSVKTPLVRGQLTEALARAEAISRNRLFVTST